MIIILYLQNKESVGSAVSKKVSIKCIPMIIRICYREFFSKFFLRKQAKTTKDTPSSSQGVPVKTTNTNADDDDGDFISSNKSTISRSHWKDTSSSSLQSLE